MEINLPDGLLGRSPEELIEAYRAATEVDRDNGSWCYDEAEHRTLNGVTSAISYLAGEPLAPPTARLRGGIDGACPPRDLSDITEQIEAARRIVARGYDRDTDFAYGVFYTLRFALGHDEIDNVVNVADSRRTYSSAA